MWRKCREEKYVGDGAHRCRMAAILRPLTDRARRRWLESRRPGAATPRPPPANSGRGTSPSEGRCGTANPRCPHGGNALNDPSASQVGGRSWAGRRPRRAPGAGGRRCAEGPIDWLTACLGWPSCAICRSAVSDWLGLVVKFPVTMPGRELTNIHGKVERAGRTQRGGLDLASGRSA
jgi:hypothetical protein